MPKVLTNRRVQFFAGFLVVTLLIGTVGSIGVASVVGDAVDAGDDYLRSTSSGQVYSDDGELIANLHGGVDREPVDLEDMPQHLQDAVIAIEDRRFFEHGGLDLRGIARAAVANLTGGGRQGGSTISQQLAKNLYFHGEPRTMWRKGAEAIMALGLEDITSKDQILEGYLNTAFFGRGVYGVQAAAKSYFRKDAPELTLGESAFLAGLVHMPARYDFMTADGVADQEERRRAATARRNTVLGVMAELSLITADQAREASREELKVHPPRDQRWRHPYFVDAVLRQIGVLRNQGEDLPSDEFSFLGDTHSERADAVYRQGLRIHTTLDTKIQNNAEQALEQHLPAGTLAKASAALVSVEPGTGFVRALVGGRDYYPEGCEVEAEEIPDVCRHSKVNLALGSVAGGSGRQPGSAFKTMVLAASLEEGMSLRQTVDSSAFTYDYDAGTWKVTNYEGSGGGSIDVVSATARSVNAAYARLLIRFLGKGNGIEGAAKVADVSRKLGIAFPTREEVRERCGDRYGSTGACTPADDVPAISLGAKEVSPLSMAGAYASFANEGVYVRPTLITKITDSAGDVLYEAAPETRRAVSERTAAGVTYALQRAVSGGTGRAAQLGRPVAGKTGTSQMWRDAWFAGYIPQLTTVVWMGNPVPLQDRNDRWMVESMTPASGYPTRVTGGSYPARIWGSMMTPTVEGMAVETFPAPPGELFGPSQRLDRAEGEEDAIEESGSASDLSQMMAMRRQGTRVVVHRQCPPGGSARGIHNWKQERRGNEVHVWRSRAVCR